MENEQKLLRTCTSCGHKFLEDEITLVEVIRPGGLPAYYPHCKDCLEKYLKNVEELKEMQKNENGN